MNFFGFDGTQVSLIEKLVASTGAFIGIVLVFWVSHKFTGMQGAAIIVPSMGASAVLLFAVPHGKLSQPWALLGGNLISAFVGVTAYHFIPNLYLAAGLAVGGAILMMHFTDSIHPPGGATALAAVIGGSTIHDLGYQYVLTPVLINVSIIFCVALFFNNLFHWRKYPASLNRFSRTSSNQSLSKQYPVDKEKLKEAIAETDLVMDVSIEDMQYLFEKTMEKMDLHYVGEMTLEIGHFYSNGKQGNTWSVRRVLSEAPSEVPAHDMVMYQVSEGAGKSNTDSCTRQEFMRWAASEVFRD